MADLKQVEQAFLKADAAGDTEAASVLAGEVRRLRAAQTKPAESAPVEQGSWADVRIPGVGVTAREARNAAAGAIRGAGSIGATLLTPVDAAARALGVDPNGMVGSIVGRTDRRNAMTEALGSAGADTNSLAFGAGKLGGEVAGTAGLGGAAANILARAPGAATYLPGLINALRTGGMSTGQVVQPGALNALRDLGTRAVGGAVTGGLSAGAVNPEDAGAGAMIGGGLPVAVRAAGAAGGALGRLVRGPEVPADVSQAVQAARNSGYVIPPTQANPTLANRLLEGFSGKITTAQNASARNQTVTNRLAADTLGLPNDVPITPQALQQVRRQAGQAYDAVANSGVITPGPAYTQALDRIVAPYQTAAQGFPNAQPSPVIAAIDSLRSPSFDASAAVAQLRYVRDQADTAFAQGNRGVGRSLREGAQALEDAVEAHLQQIGNPQALQEFRDARRLIAQTYTVEKALNPTTGSVDARKLAAEVKKNRPVTGPMREAADFAARFPKASQTIEGMGSLPQTSPLDWAVGGGMSAATANPLAMAGVLARPGARALALSPVIQNRLVQGNQLNLAMDPALQQLGYRAAPVIATQP